MFSYTKPIHSQKRFAADSKAAMLHAVKTFG